MACALLRNVDSGGETSQPPLPIFPPQCEILSLRLKMRRHSLQVLHYSAIQLYSVLHQLSEIRLKYSFLARSRPSALGHHLAPVPRSEPHPRAAGPQSAPNCSLSSRRTIFFKAAKTDRPPCLPKVPGFGLNMTPEGLEIGRL